MVVHNALIDRFVLFILTVLLIVDTFNGILVRLSLPSIASVIKVFLLFVMLVRIAKENKSYLLLALVILIPFVISTVSDFIVGQRVKAITLGFSVTLRYFLIPVSFLYGKIYFQNKTENDALAFRKFIIVNFIVLALNLVLGILGVGYEQYEGGVGSVGFFYAGNEVSGVMLILMSFVADYVYTNKSRKVYILFAVFGVCLGFIKATKVAMLSTMVIVVAIPLMYNSYRFIKLKHQVTKIFLSIGVVIFAVFLVYASYIYFINSPAFNRMAYFYEKSGDIINLLLSSRDKFVVKGMIEYVDYSVFELVFGKGVDGALNLMVPHFGGTKSTEIDFFDFLFEFGIVGVVIVYGLHIYFIARSIYLRINGVKVSSALILSNILILFVSLTAGHIFNAGMLTAFIGFTNAYLYRL